MNATLQVHGKFFQELFPGLERPQKGQDMAYIVGTGVDTMVRWVGGVDTRDGRWKIGQKASQKERKVMRL